MSEFNSDEGEVLTAKRKVMFSKGSKPKDSFVNFLANIGTVELKNIETISINRPPQISHQFNEHYQDTAESSQNRKTSIV